MTLEDESVCGRVVRDVLSLRVTSVRPTRQVNCCVQHQNTADNSIAAV